VETEVALMRGVVLKLGRDWTVADRLGAGGFGQVWSVTDGSSEAAAKFVPKAPGAQRELLFVDLAGARNVVPIVDQGEHDDYWVIVMPRAEASLRDHIDANADVMTPDEAVPILIDIADALTDLDGRVVHRDLKPENVLLWNGSWCLADFGISRYAEATTAPDTHKYALSPPYAAPERWRAERATSATDVYATGILAYELLAGSLPFQGPALEDFREQHLHQQPPPLTATLPALLEALIAECLYKSPEARPRAANMGARLRQTKRSPTSGGLAQLAEVNREAVVRRAENEQKQSEARSESARIRALSDAAQEGLTRIAAKLRDSITAAATAAQLTAQRNGGWGITLGAASLEMSPFLVLQLPNPWAGRVPFKVIAMSALSLTAGGSYGGRSHSLWFGDVQEPDNFAWFEGAFMHSPLLRRSASQEPFALDPGTQAAEALGPGLGAFQVAWPFTRLVPGQLDEFVGRWAGWLAQAAQGSLSHPTQMPERQSEGSWRR
jgi:serine/threonine protein kinase